MTLKSFLVLGCATVLAVVLAIVSLLSWHTGDAVSGRGTTFLPSLAKQASDIAMITIQDGDETVIFERDGGRFLDGSGFPVNREAASNLVTSISVLKIEEKKTADASRHGELELAPPGAEDGAGKKVTFTAKDGSEIASLIVGKSDYSVGGMNGGQYVRAGTDDQTYLVRGSVKLPYNRTGWFDTKLLEIKSEQIARATISDGEARELVLVKVGEKLKLMDLPQGKVEDHDKISRITRLFENLSFSDVRAESPDTEKSGPSIFVETTDGLSIKIVSTEKMEDKQFWVRISAAPTETGTDANATSLAKKLDGFEFKLSSYDSEILVWTLADFTKDAQS